MTPSDKNTESRATGRGSTETLSAKSTTATPESRPQIAMPEVAVTSVADVLEAAIRSGALSLDRVAAILRDAAGKGSNSDPDGRIKNLNDSYTALKVTLRSPNPGWQYPGRSAS